MADDDDPAEDVEQPPDSEEGSEAAAELVIAHFDLGEMRWAPKNSGSRAEMPSNIWGETLTQINPETGEFEGRLAESFTRSDDGQTWTFTLRPDVPFHGDWGTVTSEDVRYTWEQYTHPDSNQGVRTPMRQAIDDDMSNFEIISDLEFAVHTTNPVPALPMYLSDANPGPVIHSKGYFDEVGEEGVNAHPIATGPYEFVSATPGVQIIADAVEDHWRQPPAFDRLVMRQVQEGAAILAQMQTGEVDMSVGVPTALIPEAEAAGLTVRAFREGAAGISLMFGGMYRGEPAEAVGAELDADAPWIQADNPEQGLAIREAMSLAIDRQAIIDEIMSGYAEPIPVCCIPPLNPDLFDSSWPDPTYDPELAREKLAEGGYPDGFPVRVAIVAFEQGVGVGEAVSGYFEEIGLEVEQVPFQQDPWEENHVGTFDTAGFVYLYRHPTKGGIEPALSLENCCTTADDILMLDPVVEDLYQQLVVEIDDDERMRLGREAYSRIVDERLAIPLFLADLVMVMGPDLADWTQTAGMLEPSGFETAVPAG